MNPRSYTLPPISIPIESQESVNNIAKTPREAHTRSASAGPVVATSSEVKKLDRDTLPSMTRALNLATPHMRTVTFLPSDDGHESDNSSICHSPTWDDYGKKKKKDKEADQRRKRLTKREPPPAAMDNRPELNLRAMSDPILSSNNNNTRPSLETSKAKSTLPLTDAQTEATSVPKSVQTTSVESVETVVRSPAFIGGVRLEREREAALKRLMNARASSAERPVPEATLLSQSQSKADVMKKRQTAPPTPSYPPIASKTPYLPPSQTPKGHNRRRTGSFGSGLISSAAKIFQSREKEAQPEDLSLQRNRSRESVSSIQSLFTSAIERGRQMGDYTASAIRNKSTEGHEHDPEASNKEGKKGGMGLPPLSWKNKRRERTASMMAVPPDSARDSTFPSDENSANLKQDNFSFLERPFSPELDGPLSPPASVSASLKAKMSPQLSPSPQPTPQPPKKSLKEQLKAGLRTSLPPERAQNQRPLTQSFFDGEVTLPRDSHPLKSHPLPASSKKKNKIKSVAYDQLPSPVSQPRTGPDSKYSGASSSSSHPDTESQPSSPLTSPDTSRPQSAKDNQTFRLEDLKKAMQNQSIGQVSTRPVASMIPQQRSGSSSASKAEPPRINIDFKDFKQHSISKGTLKPTRTHDTSFVEDFQASQAFLTSSEASWSEDTKKPADSDQLSFTSALTSLDVKRSMQDLNGVMDFQNRDIEPFSLEKDRETGPKGPKKHVRLSVAPGQHSLPGGSIATGSNPSLRPSADPVTGRLPALETDHRSFSSRSRTDSPDSHKYIASKASAYLEEARKAAPSSPRGPGPSKPPTTGSSSHASSPLGSPQSSASGSRTFALSAAPASSHHKSSLSTSAVLSTMKNSAPSLSSSDDSKILGKPIAKMLVECCHCRFYQDMPSRVYEAMARPDDTIQDQRLGVSGQVTTCVKCPWCAHNMSTACCAGYAAVVYLKEKLHGI